MAKIHINGWPSFEAYRAAGYPGAVSFDKAGDRQPDPRRGLCIIDGCENVEALGMKHMCARHHTIWCVAGEA